MKAARRGARRFGVWARRRLPVQRWMRRFVVWVRGNLQEWAGFGAIVAGCWKIDEVLGLLVAGIMLLAAPAIEGYLSGRRS